MALPSLKNWKDIQLKNADVEEKKGEREKEEDVMNGNYDVSRTMMRVEQRTYNTYIHTYMASFVSRVIILREW